MGETRRRGGCGFGKHNVIFLLSYVEIFPTGPCWTTATGCAAGPGCLLYKVYSERIRALSFLAFVAGWFFRCAVLSGWLCRPWSPHSGSYLLRRGRCCPFLHSCRSAPVREYPTSAVCFSRKRIAWFLRLDCRCG